MRKQLVIIISSVAVATIVVAVVASTSAAKRRAESAGCGNYIVSISCAARLWANDHNDRLPPNFLAMSNELNSPKVLHCPGDDIRKRVRTWAEFTEANSSYEIVSPSARDGEGHAIYLRCKVHGHLGYADATVFDGKRRRTKTF